MKSTLLLTATTLLGWAFVIGSAPSSWADSLPIAEDHEMTEVEDVSSPAEPTADLLLVEPRGLEVLTAEDADALSAIANQINQGIDSDSDEFLPEGMVVRGSERSVQVGGEI